MLELLYHCSHNVYVHNQILDLEGQYLENQ